jgi:phthalate 4,5-cis-dihydrodiol dehydrogenase
MSTTGGAAPRPLGIAIVGAGRVAESHARAAVEVGAVRLLAIAEVDASRRAAFAATHAGPDGPLYAVAHDVDLYERDDVELVVVALPHWLHGDAVVRALEAGKHVLVEKPMAITLDECDRMIAAARRCDRVLAVGQTHHFNALASSAKALLDSGRFGRIVWGTETVYAPRRYGSQPPWLFDREKGGGQLFSNGVHYIDRLCWTIGSTGGFATSDLPAAPDRARPVAVKALVGTFFNDYPAARPADDGAVVFIQFDTGQVATIHLTGHYAGARKSEAEYVCTRGMVKYGAGLFATNPDEPDDATYHELPYQRERGFKAQLANVAAAVRGERPVAIPGEWGRLVMSVLLAAEESSRTGREVRLEA